MCLPVPVVSYGNINPHAMPYYCFMQAKQLVCTLLCYVMTTYTSLWWFSVCADSGTRVLKAIIDTWLSFTIQFFLVTSHLLELHFSKYWAFFFGTMYERLWFRDREYNNIWLSNKRAVNDVYAALLKESGTSVGHAAASLVLCMKTLLSLVQL